jgi:signal transduction histidine kinase
MSEPLRAFFTVNELAVFFVQGQVFLILGLAMGLQWRQRSQLELARALPWLAAFGVLEALSVWGAAFIPLQMRLLSADTIQDLRFIQLLLLAATFAALLGFGLRLVTPPLPAWVAWFAPLMAAAAAAALLSLQRLLAGSPDAVRIATAEGVLRYGLGLPAALLAAFGLRQQAGRLVGPLKLERIIRALRLAGIGLVLYALAEGALVPVAPYFPADRLNETWLFQALGVPAGAVRALVGAWITWHFFRALDVFRVETDRVAQALQREQSLNAERERISRELHDGTIQSIYAAGLALDDARQSLDALAVSGAAPDAALDAVPDPAQDTLASARRQVAQVMEMLNRTIQDIRAYIYDLRAASAEEDLARGLIEIAAEFRMRTRLQIDWAAEGQPAGVLPADQRQHVYQIAREALNNVARHAHASRVTMELRYDGRPGRFTLRISDNGTGRIPSAFRQGRGVRNMQERAALLGASLEITGAPGGGTVVTLKRWN